MQDESLAIIVLPHAAMCMCAMHTPQKLSTQAYLTQTGKLQPGRGCTRLPSQHLHSVGRASRRFNVEGTLPEAVRQCGASDLRTQEQRVDSTRTQITSVIACKSRFTLPQNRYSPEAVLRPQLPVNGAGVV